MAKIVIDPDGVKHLPGSGLLMHKTACGHIDSFDSDSFPNATQEQLDGYDSTGVPNCPGCIDIALTIFDAISKKELKIR